MLAIGGAVILTSIRAARATAIRRRRAELPCEHGTVGARQDKARCPVCVEAERSESRRRQVERAEFEAARTLRVWREAEESTDPSRWPRRKRSRDLVGLNYASIVAKWPALDPLFLSEGKRVTGPFFVTRTDDAARIGDLFESEVGQWLRRKGWTVQYRGIVRGFLDGGIDLVCRKARQVLVIQCKCFRWKNVVKTPVLKQLEEDTARFMDENGGVSIGIRPLILTTSRLSGNARRYAKREGIHVIERFFLQDGELVD
jgi:hypothetical protein